MPVMARETVQFKEEGIDQLFAKINSMKRQLENIAPSNARGNSGIRNYLNSMTAEIDAWSRKNRNGLLGNFGPGALGMRGLGALGGGYLAGKLTHSIEREAANLEEQMLAIQKTTGLADEEINKLKNDLLNLGANMRGISNKDLLKITEVAGQLGIQGSNDLLKFANTVAKMESVSDLSAEEAANSFAQVLNIYHKSADEAERLGSVWNVLADTSTATESQIADLTRRIAGAGQVAGLTIPEVAALAAILKDTGTDVEVGGTAMTQLITGMIKGTEGFADAIGMSAEEFAKIWEDRPIQAIQLFLNKLSSSGKDAIGILDELGFDGTRVVSTMLKMAQGTEGLGKKIEDGNRAWEEATSLQNAYSNAGKGVNAQLDQMGNSASRAADSLWSMVQPLEKAGVGLLKREFDIYTEFFEQWKKLLGHENTNTFGDQQIRKQITEAEELTKTYKELIALREKIDSPGISPTDRVKAMQDFISKSSQLGNGGGARYGAEMQDRMDKYSKEYDARKEHAEDLVRRGLKIGNAGIVGGINNGADFMTYWKETMKFKGINALTPIAKQVGDPSKWLDDRKNLIESTAQRLDNYKKSQEVPPIIEGLSERFNRLQLAALDPDKGSRSDKDILKDLLEQNKASQRSIDAVKAAIKDGFMDFKNGKLTFIGN